MSRLLKEGLLEGKIITSQKRRPRARPPQIRPLLRPPQFDASRPRQPCSILELDQTRCHWPLGEVYDAATLFCGGAPTPGRSYCPHHLRKALTPQRRLDQAACATRSGQER
jgi:GcrA cell cycle regulator